MSTHDEEEVTSYVPYVLTIGALYYMFYLLMEERPGEVLAWCFAVALYLNVREPAMKWLNERRKKR